MSAAEQDLYESVRRVRGAWWRTALRALTAVLAVVRTVLASLAMATAAARTTATSTAPTGTTATSMKASVSGATARLRGQLQQRGCRVRAAALLRLARRFSSVRGGPLGRDAGMSTAEYAVGTIAAVAFAAVLYKVVTSPAVLSALQAIIARALKAPF